MGRVFELLAREQFGDGYGLQAGVAARKAF
jgi:hypothetical protein